jgi:tetratricopeptide (TPR) repeat protein
LDTLPEDGSVLRQRAEVRALLGDHDEAIRILRTALAAGRDMPMHAHWPFMSLRHEPAFLAQRRFDVAYNRYVIARISIDNLYIAQQEKDQARTQYVRALRGYWEAYYRRDGSRSTTLIEIK